MCLKRHARGQQLVKQVEWGLYQDLPQVVQVSFVVEVKWAWWKKHHLVDKNSHQRTLLLEGVVRFPLNSCRMYYGAW